MADKDDDFPDAVAEMADRLGLKGRDRSKYIHDHMTRGGYKAVPNYVKADDDDDDDDGAPFFRSRSRRRGRDDDDRSGGRSRGRGRRDDDDDGWYS